MPARIASVCARFVARLVRFDERETDQRLTLWTRAKGNERCRQTDFRHRMSLAQKLSRAWRKRRRYQEHWAPIRIDNHTNPSRFVSISANPHRHFQTRSMGSGTSYCRILKTLVFCCPHLGQANMRLSNPGLSGLICLNTIGVEHFGHASPLRRPASRLRRPALWAIGCAGKCRPLFTGGSATELSATDA
jgi:hypothetical protein